MKSHRIILSLLLLSCTAHGKLFETSYLKVDLPDVWSCEKTEVDWVCLPQSGPDARKAFLIFSAKPSRPGETLASLGAELKLPRSLTDANKRIMTSTVLAGRSLQIAKQDVAEALQLNSEIPGFYTYSLGTLKDGLTMMISFSWQKQGSNAQHPLLEIIKKTLEFKQAVQAEAPVAPTPQVAPAVVAPAPVPVAPQNSSNKGLVYLFIPLIILVFSFLTWYALKPTKKR